jgi:L-alanine-DL-glutamate epimerase-like enolase superfamily enzyme
MKTVRAVRAVIGPDRKLMVDANQGLTLQQALRLVRKLEDSRLHWFEEPFPKSGLESYTRLTGATDIPLAAGEREFGVQPFRRLIEKRCVSVVQPDLLRVGGVTGWRLVAGLAECNLLQVAPHFYREYYIHLSAAQSNVVAIESFDWLDSILEDPFEVRDGFASLPSGVRFRQDAIREYRYCA